MKIIAASFFLTLMACFASESNTDYQQLFADNPAYVAQAFDYPVGKPDAKGYYNAQKFTENNHLGDDWNGTGGGNTDLGDPVYVIGHGYVSEAYNAGGGWGNVVRVIHQYKIDQKHFWVESLYAHLDTILVTRGQWIKKGESIGTIGNANGQYYAHLHLEIRRVLDLPLGGGYSSDTTGYLDPTQFIKDHR